METAVDEACSNIIEHAYGGEDKGDIQCSYTVHQNSLTITLVDTGTPFNSHKIQNPDLKRPLASRKTHGLGLYIMRQWMDSVEFSNCGCDNIVTMIKHSKVNT